MSRTVGHRLLSAVSHQAALQCIAANCMTLLLFVAMAHAEMLLQEFNHDKETVRSLQIWMTPDKKGHTPQYGSNRYTKEDRRNKLLLILGGSKDVPSWEGIAPGKGIKLHQVWFCPCLLLLKGCGVAGPVTERCVMSNSATLRNASTCRLCCANLYCVLC